MLTYSTCNLTLRKDLKELTPCAVAIVQGSMDCPTWEIFDNGLDAQEHVKGILVGLADIDSLPYHGVIVWYCDGQLTDPDCEYAIAREVVERCTDLDGNEYLALEAEWT